MPLAYEASASGCTPDATTWNWTATGGATIRGGTTRSVSVTFPSSGTFTVSTVDNGTGDSILRVD